MAASPDKRVNLAVARIIPFVLLGVVVYASYAFTKPLCIDYLIKPYPHYARLPRVGTGAAMLVVFYVLILPMVVTYLRLLYNVVWNPGFLPRGAPEALGSQDQQDGKQLTERTHRKHHRHHHHHRRRSSRPRSRSRSRSTEKADRPEINVDVERGLEYDAGGKAYPLNPVGLEAFYTKDIFVCQPDGRPIYCSTCCQFKTDRAHHCREVDRCVRKMDHFCPWVGGVVSENSFKFFIQFVFYTAVFCLFTLIVCAVFTAELKKETGSVNPHWCVAIGLSGLFCLFSLGMTTSSLQLASRNLTTIENLTHSAAVWTFAVRVPSHILNKFGAQLAPPFRTISYPLQPVSTGLETPQEAPPNEERHVFAILQTQPGENPYDLGSSFKNLQQVMGFTIFDWLLPFKHSPCADHSSMESAFVFGPVMTRLKKDAGLEPNPEGEKSETAPKHVKRERKRIKRNRHP